MRHKDALIGMLRERHPESEVIDVRERTKGRHMFEEYRYPGEFEERSDVFVTWMPPYIGSAEHDCRVPCIEIIRNLIDQVQVHVNCGQEGALEEARRRLAEAGVDLEKIIFTQFEDVNFYDRDNGPNVMVDDRGRRLLVNPNWSYYGVYDPTEADCVTSRQAGLHNGLSLGIYDIVSSDLVSEGGDREFNGQGVLIAIEDTEVRKRNPQCTKEQVEEEFKRIYNLDKVIWIPQPMLEDDDFRLGPLDHKEDGTPVFGMSFAAHADEMCRFIAGNKILLAEVTDEEAAASECDRESKRRLDAAFDILSRETDADGNPFEIVRMPVSVPIELVLNPGDDDYDLYKGFIDELGGCFMDGTPWPDGPVHFYAATSYCNFLICNGVVLGQRYYREGMDPIIKEKDERARQILQECFPDRKIVMIDSFALNLMGGGVHCWTKDVAAPFAAE